MDFRRYGLIFALCLTACGNNVPETSLPAEKPSVAVNPVTEQKTGTGNILVSKGVIRSDNEISVFSRITGQLNEVKLMDGQRVSKGETLFTMDDQELRAKVELCEAELEQAEILMQEILIGQGYRKDQIENVPENIASLARIKSGCKVKEKELEIARKNLENARIKAPLSGVVANVRPTSYAYVSPGETLCKVVDTRRLIVEFSILETELQRFSTGTTVHVSSVAYGDRTYEAVVKSIAPMVDEAGMITVQAVLRETEGLMVGMTAIVRL